MALLENGYMKIGGSLALGIGAIILAPVITSALSAVARPLLKAGIKGGIILYQKTRVILAETSETIGDLVEEAKAELLSE